MTNKLALNLSPKSDLEGVRCEIIAGSVLHPVCDADKAWNEANNRAARIIDLYIQGRGLFQQPGKEPSDGSQHNEANTASR